MGVLYQLGRYIEKFIEPDPPSPLDTRFRGYDEMWFGIPESELCISPVEGVGVIDTQGDNVIIFTTASEQVGEGVLTLYSTQCDNLFRPEPRQHQSTQTQAILALHVWIQ